MKDEKNGIGRLSLSMTFQDFTVQRIVYQMISKKQVALLGYGSAPNFVSSIKLKRIN